MHVGLLGPGQMGGGIAANLLGAGHDLVIWSRTPANASQLVDAGARLAPSVTAATEGREIVITVLADDNALDSICEELTAGLAPSAIHLMMGTHGIDAVQRMAQRHAALGQGFVVAPVVGRPQVAAAGELLILAAGEAAARARCVPLFEAAGRQTVDVGVDPVSAAAMKLANNFALACAIEAMGEAFAFASAYGITPEAMHDVFVNGMFKGSSVYAGYGKRMVDEAYEPAGIRAVLALKDVDLILDAAAARNVPVPSADVCRSTLASAIQHGDGDRDWSVVGRERARAAGLTASV